MGNSGSRTVQTLRLDNMEKGSSRLKCAEEELIFLREKLAHVETDEERRSCEVAITRLKSRIESLRRVE